MDLELVGLNVQRERERLGLSLEALAELCGMRPQFLDQIERGATKVQTLTLTKIATALRLTLPDLLTKPAEVEEVPLIVLAGDANFWLKAAVYPVVTLLTLGAIACTIALGSTLYYELIIGYF